MLQQFYNKLLIVQTIILLTAAGLGCGGGSTVPPPYVQSPKPHKQPDKPLENKPLNHQFESAESAEPNNGSNQECDSAPDLPDNRNNIKDEPTPPNDVALESDDEDEEDPVNQESSQRDAVAEPSSLKNKEHALETLNSIIKRLPGPNLKNMKHFGQQAMVRRELEKMIKNNSNNHSLALALAEGQGPISADLTKKLLAIGKSESNRPKVKLEIKPGGVFDAYKSLYQASCVPKDVDLSFLGSGLLPEKEHD